MYKIFCDICKNEIKEKDLVRITAENSGRNEIKQICKKCYGEVFYPDLVRKHEIETLNKKANI